MDAEAQTSASRAEEPGQAAAGQEAVHRIRRTAGRRRAHERATRSRERFTGILETVFRTGTMETESFTERTLCLVSLHICSELSSIS